MQKLLLEKLEKREISVAEAIEMYEEWKQQGNWYPANGGTETPFLTRSGKRILYVYQPRTGKHAYLDLDNDIIIDDNDIGLYF